MILNNLNTEFLGQNNFYYDEIDSTQNEIWRLYEKDAPNGSLVMAGMQTAGKAGRCDPESGKNRDSRFLRSGRCKLSVPGDPALLRYGPGRGRRTVRTAYHRIRTPCRFRAGTGERHSFREGLCHDGGRTADQSGPSGSDPQGIRGNHTGLGRKETLCTYQHSYPIWRS